MAEDIRISSPVPGLMKGRGVSGHPSSPFSFSPEFCCSWRGCKWWSYKVLPASGRIGGAWCGWVPSAAPEPGAALRWGGLPLSRGIPLPWGGREEALISRLQAGVRRRRRKGPGGSWESEPSGRPFSSARGGEGRGAACQSKLQP